MNNNLELLPLNISNIEHTFEIKIDKIYDILDKEILRKIGLNQAIIYNFDSVEIGDVEKLEINLDNIIEARFFNKKQELNIKIGEELKGYIVIENNDELTIKENNEIYHNEYNKLTIKKYLETDRDGQVYIRYVKPCILHRKEQN